MSLGTGLGKLSHWPRTLDRLANTGSVQKARQSLKETHKKETQYIRNNINQTNKNSYIFNMHCTSHEIRENVNLCATHLDSSRGCCTVSRRGWRSLVSCCTPLFSESMICSFSNLWYLSTTFLSNTNTATSWKSKYKKNTVRNKFYWIKK